jgi:2,4-dienoyl-CoA reductase-like NADH-dependent reductase (Old Yellow Enzyme family)
MQEDGFWASLILDTLFSRPAALTETQLAQIVAQFVHGARLARDAGFHGVQLHCAHGYLLSSFISPRANKRTDEYGGNPQNRLRLILEIIDAIRRECPPPFCLAVKLNSADFVVRFVPVYFARWHALQEGGLTEEDAIEQARLVAGHGGVDIIEISGGTYENAAFVNAREAFFAGFSRRCKETIKDLSSPPLVLVTGGFTSRRAMRQAVQDGAADFIGVGRAAAIEPDLAAKILNNKLTDEEAACRPYRAKGVGWMQKVPARIIGFGGSTCASVSSRALEADSQVVWHTMQMRRLANRKASDLEATLIGGFARELMGL